MFTKWEGVLIIPVYIVCTLILLNENKILGWFRRKRYQLVLIYSSPLIFLFPFIRFVINRFIETQESSVYLTPEFIGPSYITLAGWVDLYIYSMDLSTFLLFIISILFCLSRRKKDNEFYIFLFWISLYFLVAALNSSKSGFRPILPILPALAICTGVFFSELAGKKCDRDIKLSNTQYRKLIFPTFILIMLITSLVDYGIILEKIDDSTPLNAVDNAFEEIISVKGCNNFSILFIGSIITQESNMFTKHTLGFSTLRIYQKYNCNVSFKYITSSEIDKYNHNEGRINNFSYIMTLNNSLDVELKAFITDSNYDLAISPIKISVLFYSSTWDFVLRVERLIVYEVR
jgi:hypothetical protein